MTVNALAGKPAPANLLIDVNQLVDAYYSETPDPSISDQSVSFGTSGHRGASLNRSFNENHILAITQAICLYRKQHQINGPLFLGIDTHALSQPAFMTALEVLAANGIETMIAENEEYTPTPVISHAILKYNKRRTSHLSDGIVITPSHNPPNEGGIKYNPPNGGPADKSITNWIQNKANEFLKNNLSGVQRIPFEKALKAPTTHPYNYMTEYINDLTHVVDLEIVAKSKISLGVDPMGGAGVHYWNKIANHYNLNLSIVNSTVDPTFRFMSIDWDGKIRMDPSSQYAMKPLIAIKDKFDIAFSCDTDHDRHGIVTKKSGLLSPNHFLSAAIEYLFKHRPEWSKQATVGKTVVSSQMIDRVTKSLGRTIYEVPVGFKWFVDGLINGSLAFVGEESAGATFVRRDGTVWTTDKDGIIPCLLAAEMTAKTGKDPSELYHDLTKRFGNPQYTRIDAPATKEQKEKLKKLNPQQIHTTTLAGEKIKCVLTDAPGNHQPIDGIKVETENGWFAARPSGTENLYKIYAESFLGKEHLQHIVDEAQTIVDNVI